MQSSTGVYITLVSNDYSNLTTTHCSQTMFMPLFLQLIVGSLTCSDYIRCGIIMWNRKRSKKEKIPSTSGFELLVTWYLARAMHTHAVLGIFSLNLTCYWTKDHACNMFKLHGKKYFSEKKLYTKIPSTTLLKVQNIYN